MLELIRISGEGKLREFFMRGIIGAEIEIYSKRQAFQMDAVTYWNFLGLVELKRSFTGEQSGSMLYGLTNAGIEYVEEIMDERGFIDYWNFAPQADILVVQTIKTKVKMETESGIILSTQENKETVCPDMGIVVSQGPEVEDDMISKVVMYPPQSNFPLQMIKVHEDSAFSMVPRSRIDGILVKDVRV